MVDDNSKGPPPNRGKIAAFHHHGLPPPGFRELFLAGMAKPAKSIADAALFDRRSANFRRLCSLPEYYIERCELEILRDRAVEIARALGPAVQLIDMGQCFSPQVSQLLPTLDRPWGYVVIDRDTDAVLEDARRVQERYPWLWVEAVLADMRTGFDLPPNPGGGHRVAYLPGNAIGNVTPADALTQLSLWAGELRAGGLMLVGVDLRKSVLIIEAAYDDPHGINAALMHELLRRANRELDANFDIRLFEHRVHFDADRGRIGADLVSVAQQDVRIGNQTIHFAEGEAIHVGDSWKYSVEDFQAIARGAGFRPVSVWLDSHELFSLHLLAVS